MKVSIIVPIYNSGKFLNQCIESVISQTFNNIEIILVNDGSTDNSLEICRYYAKLNKRIKVLHKKNGGASSARNLGLQASSGNYILFVDSDDYISSDMVETLVYNIEKYEADLVVCGITTVSEHSIKSTIYKKAYYENKKEIAKFFSLLDGRTNSPCNKLYKRDLIYHDFNEELVTGEDLIFNLDYFENINSVSVIDQALYFYRRTYHNSLTQTYYEDYLSVNNYMYERMITYLNEASLKTINIDKINEEYYSNMSSYLVVMIKYSEYNFQQKIGKIKEVCNNNLVILINEKIKKLSLKYSILKLLIKFKMSKTLYVIVRGWICLN